MTFCWQTEWFRTCMPLFSCLLEEAERIAAGKEGDLGKMGDLLGQIEHVCDPVEELKNCHYARQMMNVRSALLDLTQTDQKAELAAYTLLPFLWELREETYFWGCVAEDAQKRKAYWQEEFVSPQTNESEKDRAKESHYLHTCLQSFGLYKTVRGKCAAPYGFEGMRTAFVRPWFPRRNSGVFSYHPQRKGHTVSGECGHAHVFCCLSSMLRAVSGFCQQRHHCDGRLAFSFAGLSGKRGKSSQRNAGDAFYIELPRDCSLSLGGIGGFCKGIS